MQKRSTSGIWNRPVKHLPNRYDDLSLLDLQRNQQFAEIFNLTEKFAPFIGPKRDETLTKIPKRYFNTSAKDCRETRVQQLSRDPQPVAVPTQLDKEIECKRFRSIQEVP